MQTNYIRQREKIVQDMSRETHKQLAEKYMVPDKMIYLVVGDAETQLEPLKELGLGEPIMLDKQGNPVQTEAKTSMK